MKKKDLKRIIKAHGYILDDLIERVEELYGLYYGPEMESFIEETFSKSPRVPRKPEAPRGG